MQANNEAAYSFIDGFECAVRGVLMSLGNTTQMYSESIHSRSREDLNKAVALLQGVIDYESALHPCTEAYNTLGQAGGRAEHNLKLETFIELFDSGLHIPDESQELSDESLCGGQPSIEQFNEQSSRGQSSVDGYLALVAEPACSQLAPLSPGGSQVSNKPIKKGKPKTGSVGSPPKIGDDPRSRQSCPFFCQFRECSTAEKPYKFLSKLQDHERSHLPAAFTCLECGQKFKQSRILKKHLLRMHKAPQVPYNAKDASRLNDSGMIDGGLGLVPAQNFFQIPPYADQPPAPYDHTQHMEGVYLSNYHAHSDMSDSGDGSVDFDDIRYHMV